VKYGKVCQNSNNLLDIDKRRTPMATMNISLPDQLKDWIETQVENKHFSNTSDFMRDLLRDAKERDDHDQQLMAAINKGLNGKVHTGTVSSFFAEAHALALKQPRKTKPA
jgi:antitoxin ParD1/3/4